jgi:multidrug transporter EmrE-like cation transporter
VTDRLSFSGFGLALAAAVLSALGVVLVKSGLGDAALNLSALIWGTLTYLSSVLLGFLLIRSHPISIAYPVVVGLSLAFVALLSAALLDETLTVGKLGGAALIVVGVLLLVRRDAR